MNSVAPALAATNGVQFVRRIKAGMVHINHQPENDLSNDPFTARRTQTPTDCTRALCRELAGMHYGAIVM